MERIRIGTAHQQVDLVEWNNLTENDTDPTPVSVPRFKDVTVQAVGDFGVGGHVKVRVSLWKPDESPVYFFATDPQGNDIDLTAAGGETRIENAMSISPIVTAGTGVDVDVRLLFAM